jgi:hypothetical protein
MNRSFAFVFCSFLYQTPPFLFLIRTEGITKEHFIRSIRPFALVNRQAASSNWRSTIAKARKASRRGSVASPKDLGRTSPRLFARRDCSLARASRPFAEASCTFAGAKRSLLRSVDTFASTKGRFTNENRLFAPGRRRFAVGRRPGRRRTLRGVEPFCSISRTSPNFPPDFPRSAITSCPRQGMRGALGRLSAPCEACGRGSGRR